MGEKEVIGRRGLAKSHAAVDYDVWQWKTTLERERGGGRRVTKTEVQAFALESYKKAGITAFKASDGWYRRWRTRWQNSTVAASKDGEIKQKLDNSEEKNEDPKISNQNFSKRRKISDNGPISIAGEDGNFDAVKKMCKSTIHKSARFCKISDLSMKCTVNNTVKSDNNIDGNAGEPNTPTTLGLVAMDNSISREFKPCLLSGLDSLILNVNFVKIDQIKSKPVLKLNIPSIKDQPLKSEHVAAATALDSSHINLRSDLSSYDKIETVTKEFNQADTKINCNLHAINAVNCAFKPADSERLMETKDIDFRCIDNTIKSKGEGKLDGDNLWIFGSVPSDISLAYDSLVCSQGDSGISLPSSKGTLQASDSVILSPILEQSNSAFSENEHELFCNSCEDFHPHQRSIHTECRQKEVVNNSFLLNCAFEKKELTPASDQSCLNSKFGREISKKMPDTLESTDLQLNNPNVVAPKGKRYLVQFKSKVINYALNYSVKQAAENFKVNRNTISEWLAERKRLSTCGPLKLHVDQDLTGDLEFLTWLEDSKFNLTNEIMKQKTQEWLLSPSASNHQSQWLRMYANRLNGTEDKTVKKRYIAYPEMFKRAVVFHAQTHSNMAAARVFGVARKRIIEWQTGDTKKRSENKIANNVTDEVVDTQVYEWFQQQQLMPSSREVRNKAVELYRAAGHSSIKCSSQWYYRWRARHKLPTSRNQLYSNTTTLLIWTLSQLDNNKCVSQSAIAAQAASLGHQKVSRGWTFRFCRKYHALLQTVPSPETTLPSVLEQQVSDFKHRLHDVILSQGVSDDHIIALDEIPLHFVPKDQGKKPLLVRRPGFESCQASLMVSCVANGTLLPVLFVFKGSGPESTCLNDPRVLVFANDTGRVSEDMMQKWVSYICLSHLKEGGVVVTDSFDVHTTPEVQQNMTSHNVHLAVTPPGCAFRLLPVTSVGDLFKTMLEDMCQMWLSNQTAALESPSPDQLYHWAIRVHKHISKLQKEKIRNAFNNMLLPLHS